MAAWLQPIPLSSGSFPAEAETHQYLKEGGARDHGVGQE